MLLVSKPPQIIISLPVQTAVGYLRASGGLISVDIQVSSVHGSTAAAGAEICGSVYNAPCASFVPVDIVRMGPRDDETDWALSRATRATRRAVNVGLARHSAITAGSLPNAAKSSRSTFGWRVCCAIRSISAWSCSAV